MKTLDFEKIKVQGILVYDLNNQIVDINENFILNKIKSDISGWDTLYISNKINYYELIYPNSYYHGGGSPILKEVDLNSNIIIEKYK